MEELINVKDSSLEKYFKLLTHTGVTGGDIQDNMLALIAIEDILNRFGEFITDQDLRKLNKLLQCISNNCLIDYQESIGGDTLYHPMNRNLEVRISEDNILRGSEDGILRIKAY